MIHQEEETGTSELTSATHRKSKRQPQKQSSPNFGVISQNLQKFEPQPANRHTLSPCTLTTPPHHQHEVISFSDCCFADIITA